MRDDAGVRLLDNHEGSFTFLFRAHETTTLSSSLALAAAARDRFDGEQLAQVADDLDIVPVARAGTNDTMAGSDQRRPASGARGRAVLVNEAIARAKANGDQFGAAAWFLEPVCSQA